MTEFEAQTFIAKMETHLGSFNTSRLRKHLNNSGLSIESFLGIEINATSFDSENGDSLMRFDPQDAAQIIVNGLDHPPTKANWILVDYIREALLRTKLTEIAVENQHSGSTGKIIPFNPNLSDS